MRRWSISTTPRRGKERQVENNEGYIQTGRQACRHRAGAFRRHVYAVHDQRRKQAHLLRGASLPEQALRRPVQRSPHLISKNPRLLADNIKKKSVFRFS